MKLTSKTLMAAVICPLLMTSGLAFGADTKTGETQVNTSEGTVASDNTQVNERDRSDASVTAGDQAGGKDMEITRVIRRELTSRDSLSTYAHNIKIVTANGKVTLKGPVRSTNEKMEAEKIAKSVAGVSGVSNQLTIAK